MLWNRLLAPRPILGVMLSLAVAALALSFVLEHGFGVEPCILCLYERLPFVAIALLAAIGWALPLRERAQVWLIAACGMVFFTGAVLAVYHVGVEQHWWAGTEACTGTPAPFSAIEQLRTDPAALPLRACDDVEWTLAGISLAGLNAAFSALLALTCFVATRILLKLTGP